MLISCPYCGPRDVAEFTYQGDGNRQRPEPASVDQRAWDEYVYDRVNIAGQHNEIWQHSGGCRAHLRIVRDTVTHKVSSVAFVRTAAAAPAARKTARAKAPAAPKPNARKAATRKATK